MSFIFLKAISFVINYINNIPLLLSLVVAWFFLPETLKAKKCTCSPSVITNNGNITSSNSMITSDDDLEGDEENQPLLRLPKYKKMLVGDTHLFHVHECHCSYSKVNKLRQLFRKAWHKMVTMANLMKDRRVLLTSALYGLLGFVVIIADLVIYI